MGLAWGIVCADPADGGEEANACQALGEVPVESEELAVKEGLYEWRDVIKTSRGVGGDLFRETDEANEVRASM